MAAASSSRVPRSLSVEFRPKMLKDFLSADDCDQLLSSNGFLSFDQKTCKVDVPSKLVRCRSKAASTTISAIHRASEIVVNVVKHLPLKSGKSPCILPRSISRRLSKKTSCSGQREMSPAPVKVKDILRWKSFRDLAEETMAPSLDFSSPPRFYTTTTTSTTTCNSRSQSSSWWDSDFTAEDLQSLCGHFEEFNGVNEITASEKFLPGGGVGGDFMNTTRDKTEDDQGEIVFEKEQNSPVSVLDSPFREYGESFSSFNPSLANMERTRHMLMQNIQHFERLAQLEPVNLEECFLVKEKTGFEKEEEEDEDEDEDEDETRIAEKAGLLLQDFEGNCSAESYGSFTANDHHFLLDLFKHELMTTSAIQKEDEKLEDEMFELARGWMKGECAESFEWVVESGRVAYLKDMDREASWSKLEEEQEEMALELENQMLEELLVEIFWDC